MNESQTENGPAVQAVSGEGEPQVTPRALPTFIDHLLFYNRGRDKRVYTENQIQIGGTVDYPTMDDVEVSIFKWRTGALWARAKPGPAGDWAVRVSPGEYGISYTAVGKQPVTHGPYIF